MVGLIFFLYYLQGKNLVHVPPNWRDSDNGEGKRTSASLFLSILPLSNGKVVGRKRLGPCFIYLDICSPKYQLHISFISFCGKTERKPCFPIQIKAKNTSSYLIFWEWEVGERLYDGIAAYKLFNIRKTLQHERKMCMLRSNMNAKNTLLL